MLYWNLCHVKVLKGSHTAVYQEFAGAGWPTHPGEVVQLYQERDSHQTCQHDHGATDDAAVLDSAETVPGHRASVCAKF